MCASSWSLAKVILRCTVSEESKKKIGQIMTTYSKDSYGEYCLPERDAV